MKRISLLIIAFACFWGTVSAQNTTLRLSLKNTTATSCNLWIPQYSFRWGYLGKGSADIPLDAEKNATYNIQLLKPVFAVLTLANADGRNAHEIEYNLYLSPGDQLNVIADLQDSKFTVTGKGSNNNQPLLAILPEPSLRRFYGDTLPGRVLAVLNKYHSDLEAVFAKYIKTYKPSADFIKNETADISYAVPSRYYAFKESNALNISQVYSKYKDAWKKVQDSLFINVKLNNSNAIIARNYLSLLKTFVWREKERLWRESSKNEVGFCRDYYNSDTTTGKKLFNEDMQNRFQQKIVQKNFTGSAREYGYAEVLDDALGSHNPVNVVTIFDDFKKSYPNSEYVKWYGPTIDTIRKQEAQPLAKEMILAPFNGSKLNTFDDVLALAKGKTVLLDMWGTWCVPCRNEISNNGPAIKAYFKDKGLDYFYIANNDMWHEDAWKELITYLNMTGTHILANPTLSKNIMSTVKGSGYPTYIIIKKNGTWELSNAGYPIKMDVLKKQLDAALAVK